MVKLRGGIHLNHIQSNINEWETDSSSWFFLKKEIATRHFIHIHTVRTSQSQNWKMLIAFMDVKLYQYANCPNIQNPYIDIISMSPSKICAKSVTFFFSDCRKFYCSVQYSNIVIRLSMSKSVRIFKTAWKKCCVKIKVYIAICVRSLSVHSG